MAHLEHNAGKLPNLITTLSRFPVNKVTPSLMSVIHSAMDGVIIIDATQKIVLINRQVERMFSYPAEQLMEKPLDVLMLPEAANEQRRHMEHFAATGTTGRKGKLEFKGMRTNGEPLSFNASISRVTVHGQLFLALFLSDSTGYGNKQRQLKSSELRKWAVSSQQVNEVEKRRLSKKLYDDIGQRLSVLKLDLDWLESSLQCTDADLPARLAQMQDLLDNVITLTKNMASTLRPPLLDDFGLLPAVEWMAGNFQKKTSITCTVESNGMAIKLADPIESAIFRVVQESLSNIERHAHAGNAKIVFMHTGNQLDVMIRDDGIGMASGSESKPGCYGLIAMQERIFVLGGAIRIRNIAPQGVEIHATMPIATMFYSEPVSHSSTTCL